MKDYQRTDLGLEMAFFEHASPELVEARERWYEAMKHAEDCAAEIMCLGALLFFEATSTDEETLRLYEVAAKTNRKPHHVGGMFWGMTSRLLEYAFHSRKDRQAKVDNARANVEFKRRNR